PARYTCIFVYPAAGIQRSVAAYGVCAGYRGGYKRCCTGRLLLGFWRRSWRTGRPYEAARRTMGIVAQAGRGTDSTMSKESVLVCGSGIAGLGMALGLAKAGFSVSLLGPRNVYKP